MDSKDSVPYSNWLGKYFMENVTWSSQSVSPLPCLNATDDSSAMSHFLKPIKKNLLVPLLHNLNLDGLLLLFRSPTSSTGRAHFNCRFYSRVPLVLYTVTRQFTYLSVCISLSMHHFVIFCDFNMNNIMRWNGTGGAQISLWKYNSTVEEINLPIEFSVGLM